MSLVGTRPILRDELQKYELHHRARIAIKPGITGMWQVSGRSDITDFEEVVRLDTEFTCHNVILADSLKKRVPEFFNFMKVEEQIQWEKRLWVMRSWGSYGNPNSGVYSYICNHYNIPFSRFSYGNTFDSICKRALDELNQMEDFEACFDYILIDESQDFSEGFFKLCEKVTRKCVYVAGDIFQDIFKDNPSMVVNPDFLLNKCYRTDPRTLMGAHAIGMGLFENTLGLRLRWLEDDQWEACGYDIKREKGEKYIELYRKPLKRFEDIDMSKSDGVTIISSEKDKYLNTVFQIGEPVIKYKESGSIMDWIKYIKENKRKRK